MPRFHSLFHHLHNLCHPLELYLEDTVRVLVLDLLHQIISVEFQFFVFNLLDYLGSLFLDVYWNLLYYLDNLVQALFATDAEVFQIHLWCLFLDVLEDVSVWLQVLDKAWHLGRDNLHLVDGMLDVEVHSFKLVAVDCFLFVEESVDVSFRLVDCLKPLIQVVIFENNINYLLVASLVLNLTLWA